MIEVDFSKDGTGKVLWGIKDNSLEIVNNNGNVELVPILDDNNNPLWDVIEDTENEDLTHEIENIIKELKK